MNKQKIIHNIRSLFSRFNEVFHELILFLSKQLLEGCIPHFILPEVNCLHYGCKDPNNGKPLHQVAEFLKDWRNQLIRDALELRNNFLKFDKKLTFLKLF